MPAVLVLLAVLLMGAAVLAFNSLVRKRQRTHEAWAQIDVELTRRHDLIPNLVQAVSGYAEHERTTFETVATARTAAMAARRSNDPAQVGAAEQTLSAGLQSLLAVAEGYPQLRASENFRALQEELTATEDKLEYARRYYNTSVRDYDNAVQTFPRNLLALLCRFRPAAFFEAETPAWRVPSVRLTPDDGTGS